MAPEGGGRFGSKHRLWHISALDAPDEPPLLPATPSRPSPQLSRPSMLRQASISLPDLAATAPALSEPAKDDYSTQEKASWNNNTAMPNRSTSMSGCINHVKAHSVLQDAPALDTPSYSPIDFTVAFDTAPPLVGCDSTAGEQNDVDAVSHDPSAEPSVTNELRPDNEDSSKTTTFAGPEEAEVLSESQNAQQADLPNPPFNVAGQSDVDTLIDLGPRQLMCVAEDAEHVPNVSILTNPQPMSMDYSRSCVEVRRWTSRQALRKRACQWY